MEIGNVGTGRAWFLVRPDRDGVRFGFTDDDEQDARYAVHAVNTHERLVAMLRSFAGFDGQDWMKGYCDYCGSFRKHAHDCELAALLAECEAK